MNLNMVTSQLRILGNSIQRLEIQNDISRITSETAKVFGMDIDLLNCEKKDDYYTGSLLMTIELELKQENQRCSISMDVAGDFCAETVSVTEKEFERLLLVNGAAALYSIARGKMEVISALTFEEGKLTLPFVNMIDFYRDKFKVAAK